MKPTSLHFLETKIPHLKKWRCSLSLLLISKPQFAKPQSQTTLRLPNPFFSLPKPLIPSLSSSTSRTNNKTLVCKFSYTATPATDHLISASAYLLPFFKGLQHGRYLFLQYPILASAFQPILPLLSIYRSVPYGSFVAFFAFYLAVVRNSSLVRYVRFNAMQAVVLDVLLALPMLVERICTPGQSGLGFNIMVWGHSAVFVLVVFCFAYSLVSCVLRKTLYLRCWPAAVI